MTLYDPYVNMLRTTTGGMSAILGNTDSLTVLPFDAPFAESGDFSDRIAQNQQMILKNESYLDRIADPAAGSYYIETLTGSIATHAWELFLHIQEQGGMIACIKAGTVQEMVAALGPAEGYGSCTTEADPDRHEPVPEHPGNDNRHRGTSS